MKLEKANFFWDGAHSKFDECFFWVLKFRKVKFWRLVLQKKNLALEIYQI